MADLKIEWQKTEKGDLALLYGASAKFSIFFGNRFADQDCCQSLFANQRIVSNKQTHSYRFVSADSPDFIDETNEADALVSKQPRNALMVYTADCLPVMVIDPNKNRIAAIHAGWRGLFAGICENVVKNSVFDNPSELFVFAGPHIQANSFEVKPDIFDRVLPSLEKNNIDRSEVIIESDDKYFINMKRYLELKMQSYGIDSEKVHSSSINTVSSPKHCSFRRDGPRAGHQLSLVSFEL